MSKELQPHQQRVVEEAKELHERLEKLLAFRRTDQFLDLEEEDQVLLLRQCYFMRKYESILRDRIARF